MAFYRIASGAGHGLRYVTETDIGQTPATPNMKELTYTECSLGLTRETLESQAIRSDRQRPFTRTGTDNVGGSIGFELGAREYDDLLAAALCGSWDNNVVKAGKTFTTMTMERSFDVGFYQRMPGCCVNQMSLSVQPSALITGSFEMVGLSASVETLPLSDSPLPSYAPVPFDSFTGSIVLDGEEIAVAAGIDLTLANGVEAKYAVFHRSAVGVLWGRSIVSGSISAFITPGAPLMDKFINDAKVKLEFTLSHGEYAYTFLIPNITLTSADNPVSSEMEIMQNCSFEASLGTVQNTNIQITRTLPATP